MDTEKSVAEMGAHKKHLRDALALYLVTDDRWLSDRTLERVVAEAIAGGVTFVQLRKKGATTAELIEAARPLISLCRAHGVPFVINDDVEAARLAGADGVHVGQSDAACSYARAALGADALVGVSAQTVEQARSAEAAGADYLGVGAVFPTGTKTDADVVSLATLQAICDAVRIPVIAIGGIDLDTVCELSGIDIAGVAVVSAIMAADEVTVAAQQLSQELDCIGKGR